MKQSKVTYDDRRKELTHENFEDREAKINDKVIGNITIQSKGVYNEDGIKIVLSDLDTRRVQLEQEIKNLKNQISEIPEMTEDLKQLREQLIKLQTIEKSEKLKHKLENLDTEYNQVKKDIFDIKDTIGSRLKL